MFRLFFTSFILRSKLPEAIFDEDMAKYDNPFAFNDLESKSVAFLRGKGFY